MEQNDFEIFCSVKTLTHTAKTATTINESDRTECSTQAHYQVKVI